MSPSFKDTNIIETLPGPGKLWPSCRQRNIRGFYGVLSKERASWVIKSIKAHGVQQLKHIQGLF